MRFFCHVVADKLCLAEGEQILKLGRSSPNVLGTFFDSRLSGMFFVEPAVSFDNTQDLGIRNS